MSASRSGGNPAAVGVVGATGHTGRFVVAELLRRGIAPIAIARDAAALAALEFGEHEVERRRASIDDAKSLDRTLDGAQAVIHCAGPFLDTADAVVDAALRAGIHYADLSAEQASARATLDRYDAAAREAGIAVVPAMGFYGGFADLLATAALGDWDDADRIDIMIGLDSWHPTQGTRATGARNTAQRVVVAEGRLAPVQSPRAEREWRFGDPLGQQTVVETPFSEIILLARHVKAEEVRTWLSSVALSDIHNPATPAPKAADGTGRSAQRFAVDAVARSEGKIRRASARGRDIYAFSAPLVCEAVERLLDGRFTSAGAQPAGAIFAAREFLAALTPEALTLEMAEA